MQKLLAAFEAADAPNRLQLAAGFAGYAAAFELAKSTDGVVVLQAHATADR